MSDMSSGYKWDIGWSSSINITNNSEYDSRPKYVVHTGSLGFDSIEKSLLEYYHLSCDFLRPPIKILNKNIKVL